MNPIELKRDEFHPDTYGHMVTLRSLDEKIQQKASSVFHKMGGGKKYLQESKTNRLTLMKRVLRDGYAPLFAKEEIREIAQKEIEYLNGKIEKNPKKASLYKRALMDYERVLETRPPTVPLSLLILKESEGIEVDQWIQFDRAVRGQGELEIKVLIDGQEVIATGGKKIARDGLRGQVLLVVCFLLK